MMNKTIENVSVEKCMGCYACYAICPVSAIEMKENAEGFLYPVIDTEKCTMCGVCYNQCPVVNVIKTSNTPPQIWSCWHKDHKIVEDSSSGGIFTALAEYILNKEGVVYGAEETLDLSVKHTRVVSCYALKRVRGSKYIQSHIGTAYSEVQKDIKDKLVLFTGTPCQIAGLYSYLGNCQVSNLSNLYTCEVICHGVNSVTVLRAYISYLEGKIGKRIQYINFRSKKNASWERFNVEYHYDGGCKSIAMNKDSFFYGFLKNYYLRLSCYQCPYAKIPRVADLTIGDFWFWEKEKPECFNDKGTNVILLNNQKGEMLFQSIMDQVVASEVDFDKVIRYNPNILKPTEKPNDFYKREIIFELIEKKDYKKLFKFILKSNARWKAVIKNCIEDFEDFCTFIFRREKKDGTEK